MRRLYVASNCTVPALIGVLSEIEPGGDEPYGRRGDYQFEYRLDKTADKAFLTFEYFPDITRTYAGADVLKWWSGFLPSVNGKRFFEGLLKTTGLTRYDEWEWLKAVGRRNVNTNVLLFEQMPEASVRSLGITCDSDSIWLKDEHKGAMSKIWMRREGRQALFKWTENKMQNAQKVINELEAAGIAAALGIKHAEIEMYTVDGITGALSYDAHTDTENYLYISASLYAETLRKSERTETPPNLSLGGLSVEYIQKNMPAAEKDMVDMLFFDCLINNSDRHGDNWHLKVLKETGQVVGLCGVFDHDNAFQPEPELKMSGCAVRYEENANNSHKDAFKKLSADYPRQIGELLKRAGKISDSDQLNDLCVKRLNRMERYYAYCKNIKRAQNRELG
jgi:hypothetical protein